jgi:hypothetical protein
MEFKNDTDALTILQNPPDDHFLWIAALDHLLHKSSGDTRLRMMNKFESMPNEKKIEVRRMLEIYQATQALLSPTGK